MNISGLKGASSTRITIAVFLLAAVIIFLWYNGFYTKIKNDIQIAQQEYNSTKALYDKAMAKIRAGTQLIGEFEELKHQWEVLKLLVPTEKELPDLMENISLLSINEGLAISDIRGLPKRLYDDYEQFQYEFALKGSFHGIGRFLTKVAKLARIVTISNMKMEPIKTAFDDPTHVKAIIVLGISSFTSEPKGLDIDLSPIRNLGEVR